MKRLQKHASNDYKELRNELTKLSDKVDTLSNEFSAGSNLYRLVDDFQNEVGKFYRDLNRETLGDGIDRIYQNLNEVKKEINKLNDHIYNTYIYNTQDNY